MEARQLLTRTLWTCLLLCNVPSHATDERLKNVPECKDGYEKVPNSTMCLVDSHSFIRGAIQRKQRRLILAEHNRYRSSVSPTATSMMRVYWDKELARVASKWARQCMFAHDQERFMPKYNTDAGQNVAVGYMNWKTAIKGWHDEVDIYKYGVKAKLYLGEDGWKKIGHYTQVVKDTVTLVGCGYAKCSSGFKRYFVCNYLSGQGRFEKPYTAGKTCGDCPNSCDEHGLCDCGKLFCFNGGSLNIDNCTCACVAPWHGRTCLHHPCGGKPCLHGGKLNGDTCQCDCVYPYTGDTCQTLSCEEVHDPRHCGSQWDHTMCEKRAVRDGCPVMCGLCPGPCGGKTCQNNGDLDIKTCKCQCRATYTGEMCEIAPCNGKRCRNGGLLQLGSCKCECPGVFYGGECEQVNCQGHDDSPHCYTKDETYCSTSTMGPANCRVLCGLCTATCEVTRCQNGGTFNAKTCECLCQPAYMGLECDTLNCGQYVESETCVTSYSAQLCGLWPPLRHRCPVLCGLC